MSEPFAPSPELAAGYDLIVVGSGFAATFFLHGVLARAAPDFRVLVLERGHYDSEQWQRNQRRHSRLDSAASYQHDSDQPGTWAFSLGLGGSSNCWWGNTPRMLAEDFQLYSRYHVGRDWPLSYAELAPYYAQAERLMMIAGQPGFGPAPADHYPLPAHRLSEVQQHLASAYPQLFGAMPSARASAAGAGRAVCCANGICDICPTGAKFTISNSLMSPFLDPRVTLSLNSRALQLLRQDGHVNGLLLERDGRQHEVKAERLALAANPIFNPELLLRSGFEHPALGAGLQRQLALRGELFLHGLKNFNGSSSVTGVGYMGYAGAHRAHSGACLIETWNTGQLRAESGRWQQVMGLRLLIEDLPQPQDRVQLTEDLPQVQHAGPGQYGQRGLQRARDQLPGWLRALPVEELRLEEEPEALSEYAFGGTVMGDNPQTSVLDAQLRLHEQNQVFVLGSGAFPTAGANHPALTIAALSLRAAESLQL